MYQPKTILLIEDHPLFSQIMKRALSLYTPHQVIHCWNGLQIIDVINEHKPDLLILDYDLPCINGIEIYDLVHAMESIKSIPAIMVSADLPFQAIQQRNIPGLSKPCPTGELIKAVEQALYRDNRVHVSF